MKLKSTSLSGAIHLVIFGVVVFFMPLLVFVVTQIVFNPISNLPAAFALTLLPEIGKFRWRQPSRAVTSTSIAVESSIGG